MGVRSRRWSMGKAGLLGLVVAIMAMAPAPRLAAQEDHTGLTRASFRRNCLMCHNKAAPEGISAEIMDGLRPTPGLKPFDAMPGLSCWRRCEACKLPDPVRRK